MKTTTLRSLLNKLDSNGNIIRLSREEYYLGTGDHAPSIHQILSHDKDTATVRITWDTRQVSLDSIVEVRG